MCALNKGFVSLSQPISRDTDAVLLVHTRPPAITCVYFAFATCIQLNTIDGKAWVYLACSRLSVSGGRSESSAGRATSGVCWRKVRPALLFHPSSLTESLEQARVYLVSQAKILFN